jgi:hypothetical protein
MVDLLSTHAPGALGDRALPGTVFLVTAYHLPFTIHHLPLTMVRQRPTAHPPSRKASADKPPLPLATRPKTFCFSTRGTLAILGA